MYSCDFVHLSVTDSGIGFGLCQIISWRKYQPSARNAKANIHGIPIKSFCLHPVSICLSDAKIEPLFVRCFGPPVLLPALPELEYESPILIQIVPSFFKHRWISRNNSTRRSMYCSGVSSNPICSSTRTAPQRGQTDL